MTLSQSPIDTYLDYIGKTESPLIYHRWSFITCAAAILERKVWFDWGHIGLVYPNMYTLLVGTPGTRKDTAINAATKVLKLTDYKSFAPTRTTREKFLLDYEIGFFSSSIEASQKSANAEFDALFSSVSTPIKSKTSPCFIAVGEFIDFIGQKNINFINTLTVLWDNGEIYEDKLKNSKSVKIIRPIQSILGGITPAMFASGMPIDVIGQGFTSRLMLVYSDPTNIRITYPPRPDPNNQLAMVDILKNCASLSGEMHFSSKANKLIDAIYHNAVSPNDVRLQYYFARRLAHLIKLCLVISALKGEMIMSEETVIEANTILTHTEINMHKALGEFGNAKFSEAAQKIMEALGNANGPVSTDELWQCVAVDLDKYTQMFEVLDNLERAGKIIASKNSEFPSVILNKGTLRDNLPGINYEKYIRETRV